MLVSLLGLGSWALYVWSAAPGLTWYDAGELTAAAHSLGIAHPTGFPTWILLAKAASLLPVGTIALRVTLVSSGCLAAAALLAGLLATRLAVGRSSTDRWAFLVALLVTGLGVVFSSGVWRHASAPEVYGLHGLCVTGLLLGLHELVERPSVPLAALLAFLAGLGLGNHGELRLLLVLVFLPLAMVWLWARLPWRAWGWSALFGCCGLAVHLVLPVRAAARPASLWDDVSRVGTLLDHLTAQRIFNSYGDQMWVVRGPVAQFHFTSMFERLWGDVSMLALVALLGVGGLVIRSWSGAWVSGANPGGADARSGTTSGSEPSGAASWQSRSVWLCLLLAVLGCLLVDLLYTFLVNPMGIKDAQVLLTSVLMVAVLAGTGCGLLVASRGAGRPRLWGGLALAAVILATGGLQVNFFNDLEDKAHGQLTAPASLVADALDLPEPHALLLTSSDSLSAGVLYATVVERARPDLRHAVRQHLPLPSGRRHVADLFPTGAEYSPGELVRAQLGLRAVYWECEGHGDENVWRQQFVPHWPLWRVMTQPAADGPVPIEPQQLIDRLMKWSAGQPLTDGGRDLFSLYLEAAALHEVAAGRLATAYQALQAARVVDPRSADTLRNLGALASFQGRMVEAVRWTEEALALDPSSATGHGNLGRYRLALRDHPGAEEAFRQALAIRPDQPDHLAGLAVAVANQRRLAEAGALLEQVLRLDPHHEEARLNLEKVRSLLRGSR